MTQEEAQMFKKTGGKGPGDCKGKEECEAFCDNPDNMPECIDFGVKAGMMSPEEAEKSCREFTERRGGEIHQRRV
ncbi:MAG: hypothetical protein AABY26_00830, partial [Nanoarchaeota archaeon]